MTWLVWLHTPYIKNYELEHGVKIAAFIPTTEAIIDCFPGTETLHLSKSMKTAKLRLT